MTHDYNGGCTGDRGGPVRLRGKGVSNMLGVGVSGSGSFDRRRWPRVRLAVPVRLSRGAGGGGGAVSAVLGQSVDISPGGVSLTAEEGGVFVPGEVLTVSVSIPWESRRTFPFSRIVGTSRVVRVEPPGAADLGPRRFALAFSEGGVTLLGSGMTPR